MRDIYKQYAAIILRYDYDGFEKISWIYDILLRIDTKIINHPTAIKTLRMVYSSYAAMTIIN